MSADELTPEELEAETAESLPDREAMSTLPVIPPILDLDANVDAALDIAAPINARVAANANAALPIDAAASANVLSEGAQAGAAATADLVIGQTLDGEAIATADQTSAIGQGQGDATAVPPGRHRRTRPRRANDMAEHDKDALSESELEAETAEGLPEREAMSSIPTASRAERHWICGGLLDLDVNVDLSADAAAPVGAAVAANANVAAPIDAAVAANVASPDATAAAAATQNSMIIQDARRRRRSPTPTRPRASSRARAAATPRPGTALRDPAPPRGGARHRDLRGALRRRAGGAPARQHGDRDDRAGRRPRLRLRMVAARASAAASSTTRTSRRRAPAARTAARPRSRSRW